MATPSEFAGPPAEWAGPPISPTLPHLCRPKVCLMPPGPVQPEVAAKHRQELIIKTIHMQVFLFAAPGPVQLKVAAKHSQKLIIKTIHKQVFLFAAPGARSPNRLLRQAAQQLRQ